MIFTDAEDVLICWTWHFALGSVLTVPLNNRLAMGMRPIRKKVGHAKEYLRYRQLIVKNPIKVS